MIPLCSHGLGRRHLQPRMRLDRSVILLDAPSFLIDFENASTGQLRVTCGDVENARAAVLVRKDFADDRDWKIQPLEEAGNGLILPKRE